MKASDDEPARKFDPWELVSEAVTRMKRNGDVMRSDRLKQVMQDIDPTFDEKNLGMSKFSRFVQQAHERGLLSVTKLENGQLEVGPPQATAAPEVRTALPALEPVEVERPSAPADGMVQREAAAEPSEEREERGRRGRRGRGRGRGREREDRGRAPSTTPAVGADLPAPLRLAEEPVAPAGDVIGAAGERLTRNEAFDLVRRAVETLTTDDDDTTRASAVRHRAREILGRDSESLHERMFIRILKDAHDSGVIDLRRRGDDFEVARAAEALPVTDQVARADTAASPPRPTLGAPAPRLGMGPRGGGGRGRGRLEGPPPELLAVGVVDEPAPPRETATPSVPVVEHVPAVPAPETRVLEVSTPSVSDEGLQRGGGRKRGGRRTPAASMETVAAAAPVEAPAPASAAPTPRKSRARTAAKTAHRRARTKKAPKTEN
jgi:hypothetical protein